MKLRPRHPWLFVLALIAASALWYLLSGHRGADISVRGVRATLTLERIPRDLALTSSVPDSVALQLRGPLTRNLDSRVPLEVKLDLSHARPGLQSYPIEADMIQLPANVSVVSIDPSEISLELELLEERMLPVRPRIEGLPAPGFALGELRVNPPRVLIRGPGSRLGNLGFIETQPISIEGATAAIEVTVQPRLPDSLLRAVSADSISVAVDIIAQPTPVAGPTGVGVDVR
jgi:YbbR domain-containing protein